MSAHATLPIERPFADARRTGRGVPAAERRWLIGWSVTLYERGRSHPPRRSLEVLRLIAQGLSNREIGERSSSPSLPSKGHNRNIFRKLQVRRRTEAMARARELRLL
jgi:ATP/maltotriose-dependent transcriptional regulator MalT